MTGKTGMTDPAVKNLNKNGKPLVAKIDGLYSVQETVSPYDQTTQTKNFASIFFKKLPSTYFLFITGYPRVTPYVLKVAPKWTSAYLCQEVRMSSSSI